MSLEVFNGDYNIEKEFIKLKNEFNIEVIVETGTQFGITTGWLSKNFEKVYTAEIKKEFYDEAKKNNLDNPNIDFRFGKSDEILNNILPDISNKRCLFYLDAHWGKYTPTPLELKIIERMEIKPCIVIHDFHVPGKSHPEGLHNQGHSGWGWDYYPDFKYTWDNIKNYIVDIYGEDNYSYYYNTEVAGARRGVIYITPKK